MKTKLFLTFFLLSFYYTKAQNADSIVVCIQNQCKSIKSDSGYQMITLTNSEFLDTLFLNQPGQGFGTLSAYYKNGKLCRIREYRGIKAMKDFALTEYYFSNEKLIYIEETENVGNDIFIDSSGTVEYKTDEPDFTGKYYFDNDIIIFKNCKGEPFVIPNEKYFDSQSKEGQLLTTVEEYIELFNLKKKP